MYTKEKRKDLSCTRMYKIVEVLVAEERRRRGIKKTNLTYSERPEPSCIAFGANYNLVECQLIPSNNNCNETWGYLRKNPYALKMAFDYLVYGKRFSGV